MVAVARSRFRSVRFDLEAAVVAARIVDNAGGTAAPDLLAAGLGYSGTNNGTYLTRLANARLFGLLAGRGERIELTDRGRRILAGEEPDSSDARREAFLSVPLFRAVVESLAPGGALGDRSELAMALTREFGEPEDKAPLVAAKLLDSARQAGLPRRGPDGNIQLRGLHPSFTTVENISPDMPGRRGVKFRRTRSGGRSPSAARERGGDMHDDQMFLDEGPEDSARTRSGVSPWRRVGVVAAAVACLALVAVPVSVALTGSSAPTAAHHPKTTGKSKTLGSGPAEHQVLGALSATTDSGSFDFAYSLKTTPPTQTVPTTTSTTVCRTIQMPSGSSFPPPMMPSGGSVSSSASGSGSGSGSGAYGSPSAVSGALKATRTATTSAKKATTKAGAVSQAPVPMNLPPSGSGGTQTVTECSGGGQVTNPGTPVNGSGISNTSPQATLIDANVGSGGGGLKVSLRLNSTTLYEDLGNALETGLAPPPSQANAPGQQISGFAGITESTIGNREGAVAMIGLASPTGYLDLYQQDINGATQTGTSTLNGVPVTVYKVAVDPTQFESNPAITPEETKAATAAATLLHSEGYTGTTDEISIDASGFIREVNAVANFSDGGTVVLDLTLTNFGCAGTVLMPGQQGPNDPPSGCTSPDTGQPPTAPSSSTTPAPSPDASSTTTTTQVLPTVPPTTPVASTDPSTTSTTTASTTTSTG